ncbi:15760_t:CDS:2, partial [Racocetra fulgida]
MYRESPIKSESPVKTKYIDLAKTNLNFAERAFEKLKDENLHARKLCTRGLEVTKDSQKFLEEITRLMFPNSSYPEKCLNENINNDNNIVNYKFQKFIEESIIFRNLENKLWEIDLCVNYSNYDDNVEAELTNRINVINSMINELKNSIQDWQNKQKRDWSTIRSRAMAFVRFLSIGRQLACEIPESELSDGGLVRGSNDHIVQRNYKVTAKTSDNEWADYNLQDYLNQRCLDPAEKLSIARGIANALNYCHEKDILHYDIRPWSSPERLRGEYGKASDHQKTPFITLTSKEQIKSQILKNNQRPELTAVDGIPVEYNEIIKKSWDHDPSVRYDMKKISVLLDKLDLEKFSSQDDNDYFDFNNTNIDMNQSTYQYP